MGMFSPLSLKDPQIGVTEGVMLDVTVGASFCSFLFHFLGCGWFFELIHRSQK